jgi:hypothetical protein
MACVGRPNRILAFGSGRRMRRMLDNSPRSYDYSPLRWELEYAYQYGALGNAILQGRCD